MFFKGETETFSEWIQQLFKVYINANKLLAQQTRVGKKLVHCLAVVLF